MAGFEMGRSLDFCSSATSKHDSFIRGIERNHLRDLRHPSHHRMLHCVVPCQIQHYQGIPLSQWNQNSHTLVAQLHSKRLVPYQLQV